MLFALAFSRGENYASFEGYRSVTVISSHLIADREGLESGGKYCYTFTPDENINIADLDATGYTFKYDNDFNISQLTSKLENSFSSSGVEGYIITYGYLPEISMYKWVQGKKVNVQIAESQASIIVGVPLILTGF